MAITSYGAELLRRVFQPDAGGLHRELAAFVLAQHFQPADHERYEFLSRKAQDGSLTAAEEEELDGFVEADSVLSLLRLKAQRSLREGLSE